MDFFDSDTGMFILVGLVIILAILVICLIAKLSRPGYSRVKRNTTSYTYVDNRPVVYYDDPVDDIVTAIVVEEIVSDIVDNY
jgi:hypothetical protein